jgi:hypothetical protein
MRLKIASSLALLGLLLAMVGGAAAQGPSVEWEAWNAQITAYNNDTQMDVAETQVINVLDGSLSAGERDYTQPVNIQQVYLAMNNGQPRQLEEGSGPGTYQVSNSGSDVVLQYELPTSAEAGDTFAVQINYTVDQPTAGVIDWFAVPGDHGAPVRSSTVTLNFPDGDAPDASLVRFTEGNGTVSTSGNSIVIQSQGTIQANQAFGVQLPYGAGVGAASNPSSGTNNNPVQNVPTGGTSNDSGGLGSILGILCIVGVIILFGGSSLLRGLLGGIGGNVLGGSNRGGGIFGGSRPPTNNNPFGGNTPSSGRGFRESPNQNRSVPTINNDKRRGGGASFK